jgi:hypothetical protein
MHCSSFSNALLLVVCFIFIVFMTYTDRCALSFIYTRPHDVTMPLRRDNDRVNIMTLRRPPHPFGKKYVKKLRKPLYACFVDLKKAFDSVWHTGLYLKLLRQNIRGKCFNIIESMYKQSTTCIKMNNYLTQSFKVAAGVKQGEMLSPTLFDLFTNDIPDCLSVDCDTPFLNSQDIRCLMYADDLILLSPSGLQNAINNLSKYCTKWHLQPKS